MFFRHSEGISNIGSFLLLIKCLFASLTIDGVKDRRSLILEEVILSLRDRLTFIIIIIIVIIDRVILLLVRVCKV